MGVYNTSVLVFCWIVSKGEAFKILNDLEADELRAIWSHDNISSASKVSLNLQVEIMTNWLDFTVTAGMVWISGNHGPGNHGLEGLTEGNLCMK